MKHSLQGEGTSINIQWCSGSQNGLHQTQRRGPETLPGSFPYPNAFRAALGCLLPAFSHCAAIALLVHRQWWDDRCSLTGIKAGHPTVLADTATRAQGKTMYKNSSLTLKCS